MSPSIGFHFWFSTALTDRVNRRRQAKSRDPAFGINGYRIVGVDLAIRMQIGEHRFGSIFSERDVLRGYFGHMRHPTY